MPSIATRRARRPAAGPRRFDTPRGTLSSLTLELLVWLCGIALVMCALYALVGIGESDAHPATLKQRTIVAAALMALAVGAASVVFVHRVVRRPLRRLIAGAERVAGGDLETPIDVPARHEIGHLAAVLTRLTDELRSATQHRPRPGRDPELTAASETHEMTPAPRTVHLGRLASLGRLATAVAHELNNPLSAIVMYARLVERELPQSGFPADKREELGRFLRQVQEDARRCGDVVGNLLLFARAPGGAFAVHPLNPIIERSLALVRHHADMARIRLDTHLLDAHDTLPCDPGQLQQALVALLISAVDAMPPGGCLTVRARAADASLCVDISPTGVGIAPAPPPHPVAPSPSTGADDGGAGIGSAVASHIVQRHGGTLGIDPLAATGRTFRVTLPRQTGGPQAPTMSAQPPPQGRNTGPGETPPPYEEHA